MQPLRNLRCVRRGAAAAAATAIASLFHLWREPIGVRIDQEFVQRSLNIETMHRTRAKGLKLLLQRGVQLIIQVEQIIRVFNAELIKRTTKSLGVARLDLLKPLMGA